MTMLERAIAKLKELPAEEQEGWAARILFDLQEHGRSSLSAEQIEEIERRLADTSEPFLSMEEVRAEIATWKR
jgi:hypothetical protein